MCDEWVRRVAESETISEQQLTNLCEITKVRGGSLARLTPSNSGINIDNVCAVGTATKTGSAMTPATLLQCASMSKPIGTAFAVDFFRRHNIALTASVNDTLRDKCSQTSAFRIEAATEGRREWADEVEIRHLLSHSAALGQHFVYGLPSTNVPLPSVGALVDGFRVSDTAVYERLVVHAQPGTECSYSGGGFLLLQHLIESLQRAFSGKELTINEIMHDWLKTVCANDEKALTDHQNIVAPNVVSPQMDETLENPLSDGFLDNGECVTPRLVFPAMAAGMLATASGVAAYARALALAYNRDSTDSSAISHETALQMLGDATLDANARLAHGARAFMGAEIGLGAFVARGGKGSDRVALHSGANNGFRALFMICVEGPSFGHGVVVMCNGDNNAIVTNMSVARAMLLQQQRLHGAWRNTVAFGSLPSLDAFRVALSMSNVAECSQLVAQGYKKLLFDALNGYTGNNHLL